jgi:AcrR family transcriptional regulator
MTGTLPGDTVVPMPPSDAVSVKPPAPDAGERRTAILDAAARCLADYGYDRVRLRDISRHSGVSIGLIQHYFDTRDVLLQEAFAHLSDRLISARAHATDPEQDPWDRIVDLVVSLAEDPDLRRHCVTWTQYCVVASREPTLQEGVGRIYDAWRRHLGDAIRAGVRSGRFKPVLSADDALDVLLTQIDGCEVSVAAGVGGIDGPRLRELVLRTAALVLGVPDAEISRR